MKKRSWTDQQLKSAVEKSTSYRQVLSLLNLKEAGGNYAQLKKYIKEYNLDTKHFTGRGWNKGKRFPFKAKIPLEKILTKNSNFQSYKLKKRLYRRRL